MFERGAWGSGLLAVAVAVVAALLVAGCGGDDDESGSGGDAETVALLLPESKTTRYEEQDRPNFEQKLDELCPDCELFYANADQDAAKQQQQAEAAITEGAKVLVLDAVDVEAAGAIVERAKQAGIPVVSYGRLVSDADLDYYVSIDPFEVGQQQAEYLLDTLDEQGMSDPRIVMINGSPTDSNSKPYKDGALEVFDKRGAEVVQSYDTPDWSPDKAQQEMEQAITALGDDGFDAVYVANDGMASGAIAALKGNGIDPATRPVTGQDAELSAVQRILTGEQLMTVYQPIKDIAGTSAELAVPLARGEEPPADLAPDKVDNGAEQVPSALLDTIAIDADNINVMVDDGFLDVAEICAGRYEKPCQEAGLG
ncbi:MAG: substrate-binding domain-containing protein [Solirubrobacterales bacterium]|nr:substrate-binding domain-containing protein [Solirubrobacterales bacterium]